MIPKKIKKAFSYLIFVIVNGSFVHTSYNYLKLQNNNNNNNDFNFNFFV
jgi:hypothetical protein